jgi:hypothetical protein
MNLHKLVGCSAAAVVAAGAMFASIVPTQATMYHITDNTTSYIQHVDCAVGAHIGPLGGCILGTDDSHRAVDEHRDDNAGCGTKSVTRQDAAGNSETKTKTNC